MRYRFDAKTGAMLVLNEKTGRWNKQRASKGKLVTSINVFSDIKEFTANATDKPVHITSRSQLRAYERSNGIRQAGDFKPGEIIARQTKRNERDMQIASRLTRDTRLRPGGKHFEWL